MSEITTTTYSTGDVAKAASCSVIWVIHICKEYGINVKMKNGRRKFTADQKDRIVKLRWLIKDWKKCVEYCWKNDVKL